jgi:hypothetical protein
MTQPKGNPPSVAIRLTKRTALNERKNGRERIAVLGRFCSVFFAAARNSSKLANFGKELARYLTGHFNSGATQNLRSISLLCRSLNCVTAYAGRD